MIECTDCEKRKKNFNAKCSNLGADGLLKIETGNSDWYFTNCKADCGLCSGVLSVHKAVQCDGCEMWIHNESGCSWICPKCEFFNFSDSFFVDQLNLMNRNIFDPLTKEKNDRISSTRTNQTNSLGGLKFISLNINSFRGKKLDLLAFLDVHNPHIVAIQETKIDSSISTSELFSETCPYNIFRKNRNLYGGGMMFLIHKDIPHMPLSEMENNSESVWVKVFANKTSYYVASWYRPPGGSSEDFLLFRDQLDQIRNKHKGKNLPSVHVLGDYIPLHRPAHPQERNLGGRYIYNLYHKGDFESMRKDASDSAKDSTSMVTRIIARFRKTLI